ncbi:MAG: hypothetical protein M3P32_09810 [Chloroflexota bacterium]|nr:hypothetical protein [Chloroflexota bacterium]
MRGGQRAAAILVAVTLLVACGSSEHPTPGGPSFESDEVRFTAPTGWEMRRSTEISVRGARRFLYLANQPLDDDCSTTGSDILCHPPIDGGLRSGGILVTWVIHLCVAEGCDLPTGPLIAIGNRQGVLAPMDAGCEELEFTERSAHYVSVTPQRVDILITCARDPSDATRLAFLGFLDAIHWRIP